MSADEPGCLFHFLPPWPFWVLALHSELSSLHLQDHAVICKASTLGSEESVHVCSCRASVYVTRPCALHAINLAFPKQSAVWCLEVILVIVDHKFPIPVVFLHWRWCSVPSSLLQEMVVVSFYHLRNMEKPLAETLQAPWFPVRCDHLRTLCISAVCVAFFTPKHSFPSYSILPLRNCPQLKDSSARPWHFKGDPSFVQQLWYKWTWEV